MEDASAWPKGYEEEVEKKIFPLPPKPIIPPARPKAPTEYIQPEQWIPWKEPSAPPPGVTMPGAYPIPKWPAEEQLLPYYEQIVAGTLSAQQYLTEQTRLARELLGLAPLAPPVPFQVTVDTSLAEIAAMMGRDVAALHGGANNVAPLVTDAALAHGIDPLLFHLQVAQESGYNPGAVEYDAAGMAQSFGLAQINNRWGNYDTERLLSDPAYNLDIGAGKMAANLEAFGGDVKKAVWAYHRGIQGATDDIARHGEPGWLTWLAGAYPVHYQHIMNVETRMAQAGLGITPVAGRTATPTGRAALPTTYGGQTPYPGADGTYAPGALPEIPEAVQDYLDSLTDTLNKTFAALAELMAANQRRASSLQAGEYAPPSWWRNPGDLIDRWLGSGLTPQEKEWEAIRQEQDQLEIERMRLQWLQNIYTLLPLYIQTGDITSLSSLMEYFPFDYATEADLAQVGTVLETLTGAIPITGRTAEMLQIYKERMEAPDVTPVVMERMTSEEIQRRLRTPAVHEAVDDEQALLDMAQWLGRSPEEVQQRMEMEAQVIPMSLLWKRQMQESQDLRAGLKEAKMPPLTARQKASRMLWQTFQGVWAPARWWTEQITHRMVGTYLVEAQRISAAAMATPEGIWSELYRERQWNAALNPTQIERLDKLIEAGVIDVETAITEVTNGAPPIEILKHASGMTPSIANIYQEARQTLGPWDAWRETYEQWVEDENISRTEQMMYETVFDPLIWAEILSGVLGFKTIYQAINTIQWMPMKPIVWPIGKALNLVGRPIGAVLRHTWDAIPKSPAQKLAGERIAMDGAIQYIVGRELGLDLMANEVPDLLRNYADEAIEAVRLAPYEDTPMVIFGRQITKHPPLVVSEVLDWSDEVGGKLTRQTPDIIGKATVVDDLVEETINLGRMSERTLDQNIDLLLAHLDAPLSEEARTVMGRLLQNRTSSIIRSAKSIFQADTIGGILRRGGFKALDTMEAILRNDIVTRRAQNGLTSVALGFLDGMPLTIWHRALQPTIRAGAVSNLIYAALGPGNLIENAAMSLIRGQTLDIGTDTIRLFFIAGSGLQGLPPIRDFVETTSMVYREAGEEAVRRAGLRLWQQPVSDLLDDIGKAAKGVVARDPGAMNQLQDAVFDLAHNNPRNFPRVLYEWPIMRELFRDYPDELGRRVQANFFTSTLLATYETTPGTLFKEVSDIVKAELRGLGSVTPGDNFLALEREALLRAMVSDRDVLEMGKNITMEQLEIGDFQKIWNKYPDIAIGHQPLLEYAYRKGHFATKEAASAWLNDVFYPTLKETYFQQPEVISRTLRGVFNELIQTNPQSADELLQSLQEFYNVYFKASQIMEDLPAGLYAEGALHHIPVEQRMAYHNEVLTRLFDADIEKVDEVTKVTNWFRNLVEGNLRPVRSVADLTWDDAIPVAMRQEVVDMINSYPVHIRGQIRGFKIDPNLEFEAAYTPSLGTITGFKPEILLDKELIAHEIGHTIVIEDVLQKDTDKLVRFMTALDRPAEEIAEVQEFGFGFLSHRETEELMAEALRYQMIGTLELPELTITPELQTFLDEYLPKTYLPVTIEDDVKPLVLATLGSIDEHNRISSEGARAIRRDQQLAINTRIRKPKLSGPEAEAVWQEISRDVDKAWRDLRARLVPSQTSSRLRGQELIRATTGVNPDAYIPLVGSADRELTLSDVARLFNMNGDELSQTFLVAQAPSRESWIKMVMERADDMGRVHKVNPADLGFTLKNITKLRDTGIVGLVGDPALDNPFTRLGLQVNSMENDTTQLIINRVDESEMVSRWTGALGQVSKRLTQVEGYGSDAWWTAKQGAADYASKQFYRTFTNYNAGNIMTEMARHIFPYFTYTSQKYPRFWRIMFEHPGLYTSFDKYVKHTRFGYMRVPGTSFEVNPSAGTMFNPWIGPMMREDYPELYDSMPTTARVLSVLKRFGFYPNILSTAALAMWGAQAPGKRGQLGEILPPMWGSVIYATGRLLPGHAASKAIADVLFPSPMLDYLTALTVSQKGGQGKVIYEKRLLGDPLTPEEQQLWDEAQKDVIGFQMLQEQVPLFTLRPTERDQFIEAQNTILEELYGITPEMQEEMRRWGYRPIDMVGGLDLEAQRLLRQLSEDYNYRWQGTTLPLRPTGEQVTVAKIDRFWRNIRELREKLNTTGITTADGKLIGPQSELDEAFITNTLRADAYLRESAELRQDFSRYIQFEMSRPEYTDLPLTWEARVQWYKDNYGEALVRHISEEIVDLYFELDVERARDPETGDMYDDWDGYWAKVDALRDSLQPDQLEQFDTYLERWSTPLQTLYREVSRTYFRNYQNLSDVVLRQAFSEDEQRLIWEWRITGDRARYDEIGDMVRPDGTKLIASFNAAVRNIRVAFRQTNPQLDAWLNFWGKVKTFRSTDSELLYNDLMKRYKR